MNESTKPEMDFDAISVMLRDVMATGVKVLLFCPSGQMSGALAIKWAMDSNKMFTKEIATAFVMQRRYEVKELHPWLFGQIEAAG